MTESETWAELRARRMQSPAALAGYESARRMFEFGDLVRELRQGRGMKQSDLAAALRTTQSAIARMEGGGVQPTVETLRKLAAVFGVRLVIGPDGVEPIPAAIAIHQHQ